MENNNGVAKFILILFFIIFFGSFLAPFLPIILPFLATLHPIVWVIGIILILVIWMVGIYNKFIHLAQKVNQAAGTIDVYLKQRFDLIPNLVETVKGYAKYEKDVLTKVTELRNAYINNKNEDLEVSATLNDKYNQLIAVMENYPELKANEGFLNLQKQLSKIESQLQAARRIYNAEVTEYNIKLHSVPSNIIAGMFGFKDAKLFEIKAYEAQNININI